MALENVTKPEETFKIIPGTYMEGISNADYHGDPTCLSSSKVKKAVNNSASYRYLLDNPEDRNEKWSPDSRKDFGSLVHALALEFPTDPGIIDREFAFMDTIGKTFRTNVDKAAKAKFLSDNKDKIVLPTHKLAIAKKAVEAIKAHPFANELLFGNGRSEISGFANCPYSGRPVKVRLDRDSFDHGIVDLKTTEDITKFEKIAKWVWHYDLSAYMYQMVDAVIHGIVRPYYFVVIDDRMRVEVLKASEEFLARGQRKYEGSMDNIAVALGKDAPEITRWQETKFEEI